MSRAELEAYIIEIERLRRWIAELEHAQEVHEWGAQLFTESTLPQLLLEVETGVILAANPAAERFYGYTPHQLVGMRCSELSVETHCWNPELVERVRKTHYGTEPARHRSASGKVRELEAHYNLINFRGREVIPVELALEHTSDETLRRYLEGIQKAGQRASRLTRQILAYARKQISQPVKVVFATWLEEVRDLLQGLLPESVCLQVQIEPNLPPLYADPDQLTQIALNLAVNARDAMPQGGVLTIRLYCTQLPETPHGAVVLEVADTGTGIAPEVLPHITRQIVVQYCGYGDEGAGRNEARRSGSSPSTRRNQGGKERAWGYRRYTVSSNRWTGVSR
ncbi:MAG: hypothetical protein C4337_00320 [Armatimonadota bacterium]